MDVALYGGLTVACAVIGGLAFSLAKLLRRKGRDHSLYSMARNGKHFTDGRERERNKKRKRKKSQPRWLYAKERDTMFRSWM